MVQLELSGDQASNIHQTQTVTDPKCPTTLPHKGNFTSHTSEQKSDVTGRERKITGRERTSSLAKEKGVVLDEHWHFLDSISLGAPVVFAACRSIKS